MFRIRTSIVMLTLVAAALVATALVAVAPAAASNGSKERSVVAQAATAAQSAPAGYRGGGRAARAGRMGPSNSISIGNPNCANIVGGYYCLVNQYWTLPNWWTTVFHVFHGNGVYAGRMTCYTGNSGYGATYCYPG